MDKCGVLGRKLGHSFSPQIHNLLTDEYSYEIIEREEADLAALFESREFKGLNVTIPYKKTVVQYLDEVSELVKKIGSVNTIVRREDGSLFGDNTDVYGFLGLVRFSKIDVKNQKVLVLGSGGASVAVMEALLSLGAKPLIISRSGENNYDNIDINSDASVIVNTTPVGMYPGNGESPLDLSLFPKLKGVIDIVYNPWRTEILLQAEKMGIPCADGLYMLVAQAKRASEIFLGKDIPDSRIDEIYYSLSAKMKNLVLVGMPGVGKTTIADELGRKLGREVIDSDIEIYKKTGRKPSEIINADGEPAFRDVESEVIKELGKLSGKVIATGGGAILREENVKALHQNGTIVWLTRDLSCLATEDRPLSQKNSLEEMFKIRKPYYEKASDFCVENIDVPAVVNTICEKAGLS
ncbi:MAG: AAA family ATPase [Lachnospiraceae bacterium]|nr:AAA family ATPase [Lachnospiraceae bacterium]